MPSGPSKFTACLTKSVRPQFSILKPRSCRNLASVEAASSFLVAQKQSSALWTEITTSVTMMNLSRKINFEICERDKSYFICRGSQSTPGSSSLAACLTSSLSTEKLHRCSVWATATRIHSISGGSTRNGLQESTRSDLIRRIKMMRTKKM